MENMTIEVILLHPEYHAMLDDPGRYQDKDYPPEIGDTNPFLHMGMHIAIGEQLSIDQPAGIRKRFERLLKLTGNEHDAAHQVMECLALIFIRGDATRPVYLDSEQQAAGFHQPACTF